MAGRRMVAFVLFDDALALNLNGPAEVLSRADQLLASRGDGYNLFYVSEAGGLLRTSSGIIVQTHTLSSIELNHLDTLMVVGGSKADAFMANSPLVRWIKEASGFAKRTCSVCNGAFLLAAAGLLDGRRAATHWCEVQTLKAMYPAAKVELDPIYIRDGAIWTSAGMTAGIDLALALLEEDYGRAIALQVAKEMVVFLHRAGGQAQFSRALAAQTRLRVMTPASRLSELPTWMTANLDADLSVEGLAKAVGMTPRTFSRNFRRRFGGTPAKLVEDLRLEAACRCLEDGRGEIAQIAHFCGFGDDERMRRVFLRRLGVPPATYRQRFGQPASRLRVPELVGAASHSDHRADTPRAVQRRRDHHRSR